MIAIIMALLLFAIALGHRKAENVLAKEEEIETGRKQSTGSQGCGCLITLALLLLALLILSTGVDERRTVEVLTGFNNGIEDYRR